jgi:hypothetical protein
LPADPQALARSLARLGIPCTVEGDGALAILVPDGPLGVPTGAVRAEIVRAAREAGFASVAFELLRPSDDTVDRP